MPDLDSQVDWIEDDVLRLIFLSCHPSLTPESRAALTLRLVGGLTTAEIARGFLTAEPTMGQRISRAKKTLSEARAEFELPTGAERTQRLDDVMAVIYLIFNEGYAATAGEHWTRADLTSEATRLAPLRLARPRSASSIQAWSRTAPSSLAPRSFVRFSFAPRSTAPLRSSPDSTIRPTLSAVAGDIASRATRRSRVAAATASVAAASQREDVDSCTPHRRAICAPLRPST